MGKYTHTLMFMFAVVLPIHHQAILGNPRFAKCQDIARDIKAKTRTSSFLLPWDIQGRIFKIVDGVSSRSCLAHQGWCCLSVGSVPVHGACVLEQDT